MDVSGLLCAEGARWKMLQPDPKTALDNSSLAAPGLVRLSTRSILLLELVGVACVWGEGLTVDEVC